MTKNSKSLITIAVLLIIISVCSCSLSVDKEAIENTIDRIEATELNKALELIQGMDEQTLKAGKDDILAAVINKLNQYLYTSTWISSSSCLVKESAIVELENYQSILEALSLDPDTTNADDFVEKALMLKKYTKWNLYYAADDDYLSEAQSYMNQGANYKSNPSIASQYYTKAYNVAIEAYNKFRNYSRSGMKEAADFYYNYAVQINGIISRSGTTSVEDDAYNNASKAYKAMINEYMDALSEVTNIVETFPTKLY